MAKRDHKSNIRVVTPQPLLPDPDFFAKTEVDPEPKTRVVSVPSGAEPKPRDKSNAKMLLGASLVSLVVIALSLFVLRTTMTRNASKRPLVVTEARPATVVVKEVVEKPDAPKADVMLNLDVEPKDADVSVHPTGDGFRIRVSKRGYQPVERTIAKGVVERIEIELERAPKRRKPKRVRRRSPKRRKKRRRKSPGDVFLTGGDL